MNKKRLILSILLLFVVILSCNATFAEDTTNNNQIQQSDDIDNSIQADEITTPKVETITTGSNSSAIQEKINSLSDGDTLNFEAGEYNNISIYVNKSITINGNGAILKGYDNPSNENTPQIIYTPNPNGYGISNKAILFIINTDNVILNGLTFIGGANSGTNIYSTLIYAYNTKNINITNNTFDGSCTGVYLNTCPDGTIYNNTIKNQASTGILNFGSARTLIKDNTVINAFNHGIDARHGSSPNVQIINNTVIGSKEGIYLMHSKGHVATNNTIINCTLSSITCYGSGNIKIYNNTLKYSRIGILLASGYKNITIGENNYTLYRLPMPPIFTYYVAEAKSDYQGSEEIMGTYTDITIEENNYNTYSETPTISEKVIDYETLLKPTGETKDVPDGATSAEIQEILNSLKDGDAIRFAENGKYYDISIYTDKNIKIIGNNATLYGLTSVAQSDYPQRIFNRTPDGGYGIYYRAILYSINNTNVSISNLNIISNYPDHGLLHVDKNEQTTPEYQTAGIYAQKSENIVITNCKVDGASFGIMLHFMTNQGGCENAIVTNNYVTNQYTYGILNFGSKASYIANNTVINAKWHGIDVRHNFGPNVIVYNNTVIGSYEGIYLMHSQGHVVYNNIIKNSKVSSISVYGSITGTAKNIYIFNNTLEGSRIGILVGGENKNVTIGENTYKLDAQKSGDKPGFALYLVQSPVTFSDADNVPGTYSDQKDIKLDANNVTVGYKKGEYTIKVTDSEGNAIANITGTITVNKQVYNIKTDANSVASIPLMLTTGTYDIETEIISNYYYASAYKLATVTVKDDRTATALTASGKTIYLEAITKGSSYQITLKDAKGNVLANKQITVKFNGQTLKATTNAKGIATVSLKATKTGTPKATISFAGDNTYKGVTKTVTIKITKEATKLTASKKTFKAKTKNKKYTIVLKSKSGKKLNNIKVTLKIKNKLYKATVKNGKATFKITKFTKKGKYTAVVKSAGNKYYSAKTVKPKITIR